MSLINSKDRAMRVLIIAPRHADLPDQDKEVADLESVLDAEVVRNGENTLLEAVRNARFDGVWIISHANADYVQLEGNERLDAGALAQYLSAVGAKWVIINSCESYALVDKLQQFYPLDVAASSVAALGDRQARRTGALIARHLIKTLDLREALRLASPGGAAPYRFWPSPQRNYTEETGVGIEHAMRDEIRNVRTELSNWRLGVERDSKDVAVKIVEIEGRLVTIESLFSAIHTEPAIPEGLRRRLEWALYAIIALLGTILVLGSNFGGLFR
jgi:hypothetical protein